MTEQSLIKLASPREGLLPLEDSLWDFFLKINSMPNFSVLWSQDFQVSGGISNVLSNIDDTIRLLFRLQGMREEKIYPLLQYKITCYGNGDKIRLLPGKLVLGKNYPEMSGVTFSNSPRGAEITVCPNCIEYKKGKPQKWSTIYTGDGLKYMDNQLELTCRACEYVIKVPPNEIVPLDIRGIKPNENYDSYLNNPTK